MELDPRAQSILRLVVELYIDDAQPVSSSAVARRGHDLGVSPATIRSVMVELEQLGLLAQPHASAGRVPTERAFRVYLDGLMSPKLHPWDRSRLDAAATTADLSSLPNAIGSSLATLAGQVAVIAVPRFLGSHFREIGLVRCDRGRFVAFFVSPSGLLQQKLVEVDFDLSSDELQRIQNFLNDKLAGRGLGEVRTIIEQELANEQRALDSLEQRAFAIGSRVISHGDDASHTEVHVEGTSHLVEQPEFADIEKLRHMMRAVGDKAALLKLLDKLMDGAGVKVVLGSEHHVGAMSDVSCVAGSWVGTTGQQVAVTILGPQRMDYGRVVALVDYATQLFGRHWARL